MHNICVGAVGDGWGVVGVLDVFVVVVDFLLMVKWVVMAWKKRGELSDGGRFPGGSWHVFPHVIEKSYEGGEIVERVLWRGVVATKRDGRLHWKASVERRIVELWVRDKVRELRELPRPERERKVKMDARSYLDMIRKEKAARRVSQDGTEINNNNNKKKE